MVLPYARLTVYAIAGGERISVVAWCEIQVLVAAAVGKARLISYCLECFFGWFGLESLRPMIWGLKAGLGDGRVVEGKELGSGFF